MMCKNGWRTYNVWWYWNLKKNYCFKSPIYLKNINTDNMLVSDKISSYGKKAIVHLYDDCKIMPLQII